MAIHKRSKDELAKRVAQDMFDGAYVNLGIGMPTLVANHLPPGIEIVLHSENSILGMGPEDGLQVISADVPQAEMFKFCSELRSITSGQGSFNMDFSRYEQVPAHLATKISEAAKVFREE
mgnify:CR=1 FL=1